MRLLFHSTARHNDEAKKLQSFSERLFEGIKTKKTPVLVGLDPRWERLPEPLRAGVDPSDRQAVAAVFSAFCRGVIDVVAPLVPAVKPQMAFFEQLGGAGIEALAQVVGYARQKNLLVILDGKRNDIGSTAEAYASAYLGSETSSGLDGDALTVSPYLGDDSLTPFVEKCAGQGTGIFVLVKTSNPGGGLFQDLVAEGKPLYQHVAEHVETLAAGSAAANGYGSIGAVVGATYPEQLVELRAVMPHAWLLIPGFGAQGAGGSDVAGAFDEQGLGAIVNSSRGIIFAHARAEYADRFGASQWQGAVEGATHDMIAELREATSAGQLV